MNDVPPPFPDDPVPTILAVDVGLVTGMALFARDGRLLWARSRNIGDRSRLKRMAHGLLREIEGLSLAVLEGGGGLAEVWAREAARLGIESWIISAEDWRRDMLLPRERTSGAAAKEAARKKARELASKMEGGKPTSLRTDAAEAVLIGAWAVGRLA